MDHANLCRIPLKLRQNRVWRSYTGGLLFDQWQGEADAQDGHIPEEWVASAVPAKNIQPIPNEGLSLIEANDGSICLLSDVIASDPAAFLGIQARDHQRNMGRSSLQAGCRRDDQRAASDYGERGRCLHYRGRFTACDWRRMLPHRNSGTDGFDNEAGKVLSGWYRTAGCMVPSGTGLSENA
jgi:hypothetical protein